MCKARQGESLAMAETHHEARQRVGRSVAMAETLCARQGKSGSLAMAKTHHEARQKQEPGYGRNTPQGKAEGGWKPGYG